MSSYLTHHISQRERGRQVETKFTTGERGGRERGEREEREGGKGGGGDVRERDLV